MKLTFNEVRVDDVRARNGKKNTGGCYAVMKLTCVMTKAVRNALGIGELEEWPPDQVQRSGKLTGSFDATTIILTLDQKQLQLTDTQISEADIAVSLVDSFKWAMQDPDDEDNRNVLLTFSARTSDLAAAQLMIAYKFSVSSGMSKVVMNYNKPGEGSRAAVNESTLPLATDEQKAAVAEMPSGEGRKKAKVN